MPPNMHGFDFVALVLTIFWVWMLIDAFTNTRLRGGAKVLWIMFIAFTHWIGAAVYFFTYRSRSGRQSTQQMQRPPQNTVPYYQPPTRITEDVSGRDYSEGYQAQAAPPVPEVESQGEPHADWQRDEQPQATYPELPPQTMPPQQSH